MKMQPPWSRRVATHPNSTTSDPTSPARSEPQRWVRLSSSMNLATSVLRRSRSIAHSNPGKGWYWGGPMLAWTFSARTLDEVASLLRSMGRHRYVREADHAIHWSVDEALSDLASFAPRAARFRERRGREPDLDPTSRDPSLWIYADTELVIEALGAFW